MSTTSSSADGSINDGQYQYNDYHRYTCINFVDWETETNHQTFDVGFYNDKIRTTMVSTESVADQWIENVYSSFATHIENNNLVVGLDIEWLRLRETSQRNEVAVLQLCLAHQCLIFLFFGLFGRSKKLQKLPVPESLAYFLNDERITFVGAGIDQDARKLWVDHGLTVARSEELADLADYTLRRTDLYRAGLKSLMWKVLGEDLSKRRWITLSRWDNEILSDDQVEYACLDAYASFRLGIELMPPAPFNRYPQEDIKKPPKETNQDQGVKAINQPSPRR
ncbi:hypothetical protein MKW98_005967 [Papaver atlanticum]|uniref:3'-5' exonuclease domain-containing protein n=1 Tax=Papaver atlanticum TaxID=357466 RepID=A0AAD4S6F6_9MAGN|nr:hypothetical protein MKW98_005967 [Papaver atlanticum]